MFLQRQGKVVYGTSLTGLAGAAAANCTGPAMPGCGVYHLLLPWHFRQPPAAPAFSQAIG